MGTPRRKWLDESEYLALETSAKQRSEYVAGVSYAMVGAGERHNRIALNVAVQLRAAARGTPSGVYVSDMKVRIPGGPVYYYPDVMVSCGAASADTVFKEAPCLIVEVLSSSTSATDTREKLQAYQGIASLRYYVLVESERVGVSYYVRGADGGWLAATLDPGERLQVDCGSVHASLALGDVYEDTGLAVA